MKKLHFLAAIVIATFATLQVNGQGGSSVPTTVCFPASQDAMIHEFVPTTNYGTNPVLLTSRWTYGGSGFFTVKVLNQFDLTTIPTGATITSATMKLHVDVTASVYNSHRDLGGGSGNGATIQQVGTGTGSPWNESTVTWINAPATFLSSTTIPSLGELSTSDVVVDVTTMVQNMITTGINNGFQISLTDNGNYYHSLVFGSKENTSAGGIYQPELCVTYTTPCDDWSLCGNIVAPTNFIGSTNSEALKFRTSNTQKMLLDIAGRLSVSNAGVSTYQKLYVETNNANDGIQVNQTGTTAATMDLNASGGGGKRWALHSTGSGNSQGAGHLLFWDWTANVERMRVDASGNVGINTTTPTSQLEVTTTNLTAPAIKANGRSVGVYAEAIAQNSSLLPWSAAAGDRDGIAVMGNAIAPPSPAFNGSMVGVVGLANQINPLNNIGVIGDAKNATGYNTGVIGNTNSTGIYNTGVAGVVGTNTTAIYNRAISGDAPVLPNHFAGYFKGKVAIVDGTEANNFVLTSDANGLASWKNPCTLPCSASSTAWSLNGNLSTTSTNYVGTGDTQPLRISTNATPRMFVDGTSGNIGVNTLNPLHKFHINDGALMLSGAVPSFGGPQLLFSDNVTTHPNGRWAIEYMNSTSTRPSGGLNFWTPYNPGGVGGTAGNFSLFLKDDGKVGMGVTDDSTLPLDPNFCASALPNGYRLYVNGGILTTRLTVASYCSTGWADYVFSDDYKLKPLSEVEAYIKENKHLPNIPSGEQIEKEGLDVAKMQSKQMEKIEELTLYMIEMKKEIETLKKENQSLKVLVAQPKN